MTNLKRRLELGHEINEDNLSMFVEGNRIHMTGGFDGNHDISRKSSEERIAQHWAGYISNNRRHEA